MAHTKCCALVTGVLAIAAGCNMVLIASLYTNACHHDVTATVLAAMPLPEYGQCQLRIQYDGGGSRFEAYIQRPCAPEWSTSNLTGTVVAGCYNHFCPDSFEATSTPQMPWHTYLASLIAGCVLLPTGLILASLGGCLDDCHA